MITLYQMLVVMGIPNTCMQKVIRVNARVEIDDG